MNSGFAEKSRLNTAKQRQTAVASPCCLVDTGTPHNGIALFSFFSMALRLGTADFLNAALNVDRTQHAALKSVLLLSVLRRIQMRFLKWRYTTRSSLRSHLYQSEFATDL